MICSIINSPLSTFNVDSIIIIHKPTLNRMIIVYITSIEIATISPSCYFKTIASYFEWFSSIYNLLFRVDFTKTMNCSPFLRIKTKKML